jgi:hypothetical protein
MGFATRVLLSLWQAIAGIARGALACVLAILPRRHWGRLERWVPVGAASLPSAVLTFFLGAAIGIPGYIAHTEANYAVAGGFLAQALGIRPPAEGTTPQQAEQLAGAQFHASRLSMFTFAFTPAGLVSLYLLGSGAIRGVATYIVEPWGDPVLTAIDAVLLKQRIAGAAREQRAAREALEGPEVPDRLVTGKAAGLPDADYVVVASRQKPGWEAGVFVITPGTWFRLGPPVERTLHAGLRTLYPLTELKDLEVRRKSVEYELPPLSGSPSSPERTLS